MCFGFCGVRIIFVKKMNMNTVTLRVENKDDYSLLIQLIKRLKIKVLDENQNTSKQEKQKHYAIISKGGDGQSIENPVKWQQETRKDRKIIRNGK